MKRPALTPERAAEAVRTIEGWSLDTDGKGIARSFTFRSFGEAFAFMTRTALAAERLDHHPEWFNVYKRVDVMLTTHDAGGLTELDFDLARKMNRFAGEIGR